MFRSVAPAPFGHEDQGIKILRRQPVTPQVRLRHRALQRRITHPPRAIEPEQQAHDSLAQPAGAVEEQHRPRCDRRHLRRRSRYRFHGGQRRPRAPSGQNKTPGLTFSTRRLDRTISPAKWGDAFVSAKVSLSSPRSSAASGPRAWAAKPAVHRRGAPRQSCRRRSHSHA